MFGREETFEYNKRCLLKEWTGYGFEGQNGDGHRSWAGCVTREGGNSCAESILRGHGDLNSSPLTVCHPVGRERLTEERLTPVHRMVAGQGEHSMLWI